MNFRSLLFVALAATSVGACSGRYYVVPVSNAGYTQVPPPRNYNYGPRPPQWQPVYKTDCVEGWWNESAGVWVPARCWRSVVDYVR